MATEVKHGPRPRFRAKLMPGTYRATVEGHYTATDGLTAAGVREWTYNSDRPGKRQAELLGMRSAFVGWFLEEWVRHGGSWQQGVNALRRYPFGKVRQQFLEHRDPVVRAAGRVSWDSVWQAARWSLRTAWALQLEEVADLIGISASYLSRLERGERRVRPFDRLRIARALGVRIGELFPPAKTETGARSIRRRRSE